MVSLDLFKERVARAVEGDGWVIDGNYAGRGARDLVWPRADTVIWLDPPLSAILARLLVRAVRRIRTGDEIWPGTGNRETFRNQFLSRESLFIWALRTYWRRKRQYRELFARTDHAHLQVLHFRRAAEVESWLRDAEVRSSLSPPPE
jgi:hypothetical protein